MDFIKEAEYQLWAEKKFFKILEKVSEEEWTKILPEFNKSLQSIYIHKYEVMFFWFTFIYVKDSKKINDNPLGIPDFDTLSKNEFIKEAIKLLERIIDYITTTPSTDVTLNAEWLKGSYNVTNYEVIYNILNHLTYHRGQTAFIFKKFTQTVPETDYNPYVYEKLKISK